jgi:hypothetical protein
MPRVGFEPTIPAFQRAKIVHALDRATTVISLDGITVHLNIRQCDGQIYILLKKRGL